jgi:transposase
MSLNTLLPDLPGCLVEQVSQIEEALLITACSTASSSCCPDCQQISSQVHSTYRRSPQALPSSGRPVRLLLRVRRFRCANPVCRRKTFAEAFPHLVGPRAQRTSSVRDLLRMIGEAMRSALHHEKSYSRVRFFAMFFPHMKGRHHHRPSLSHAFLE